MDMNWLHTFFEWISSIIIQIPDYYKHVIDVLGYGYSDEIGYPVFGLSVVIFFYGFMFFINTHIPSIIVCPHLSLGTKFVYLLKGKPLGKESLTTHDYYWPVFSYIILLFCNPPSTPSWSLHYLALKISCALIVFHTILFFTCVILENRRLKEQKQQKQVESHTDTALVPAQ